MLNNKNKYIITAALPYANGPIHIGHLSGVYIPADIFARYLRRKNKDIIFICGSDEHGTPISIKADMQKISPQKIIDKYHLMIKNDLNKFKISFDNYSRTSSKIHYNTVINFFNTLYKKSFFIEKITQEYYDNQVNKFLADRYIIGICPSCFQTNAYGDQCEKCGKSLNTDDLINPKSSLSGISPIKKQTKHWYIPLYKYEFFLKNWFFKKKINFWKKNVFYQVKSWINEGLKQRAITRDLNWGIPVPIAGIKNKVLYVWFEAPIGYISSSIEICNNRNINWELYWKDNKTKLIQFIGKDNIVFHCIIFPIMLKAHGEYILPNNIIANEFLHLENKKISTSKNWAIWLNDFIKNFPNHQDELRYILTINMPENKDSNFSWKDFQIRVNSELISILGNYVNRVLSLTNKYFNQQVPIPQINNFTEKENNLFKLIKLYPDKIGKLIKNYSFREAIYTFMELPRIGNKYLTEESPWKIYNNNPQKVKNIIYISLQIVGMISQLSEPFLPKTSIILNKILNIKLYDWDSLKKIEILPSKHIISKPVLLFQKIENSKIEYEIFKLKNKK